MTENKPIMIDGVDVSGCEFYNIDDKTCREVNGKYDTDICEFDKCENSNCYFKQLARKTQECEELKNIINEAKNAGIDLKSFLLSEAIQKEYEEQLDQLKAENDKLKAKNAEWKTFDVILGNDFTKIYKDIKLERDKAEQKIERIRELATALCYKVMSDGVVILQEDILQIIDEVE